MKSIQPIKTAKEIESMRRGGKILASILNDLKAFVKIGTSELEVDEWVEKEITARGAIVTYKTPEVKFPNAICISTNEQIVHSVPTEYRFEKGDVVCFDLVITYEGMKVDSATTIVVGEQPTGAKKHLLKYTERSLYAGIDAIKGGPIRVGDIAAAIETVLVEGKLGIVRELVGHGIGHKMQQRPEVPNYGIKGTGPLLIPGDTIAIEPMATLGSGDIKNDDDGWTICSKDNTMAAHFEHTVMITEDGAEILTTL